MTTNLLFHYQNVLYSKKEGMFLHEAFSNRDGTLHSVNPYPVDVKGDTEGEVEELLRTMETDSIKYKPVQYKNIKKEMENWVDNSVQPEPVVYEDEEDLSLDFYDEEDKVLDICDFIGKNT